jgi:hypothetical protein
MVENFDAAFYRQQADSMRQRAAVSRSSERCAEFLKLAEDLEKLAKWAEDAEATK